MNFCPNCSTKIRNPGQKYCEDCGSQLSSRNEMPSNEGIHEVNSSDMHITPTPQPTAHASGSLFDINRNYYIIKETVWDMGFGDIMDDKGQIIGKMNRKIFSIRKKVELQELNGTVSATIHEKIISARGAQDLKDPEGNLIARIKKKILTLLHPKFFLEDPFGNRWYEARGSFLGWSFTISDCSTGKIIAEIEKADRWKDMFLGGVFDFKDTYALKILDNVTDRRILVGFVLSIDNVLHDNRGGGGMLFGGFGRRGAGFPRRGF